MYYHEAVEAVVDAADDEVGEHERVRARVHACVGAWASVGVPRPTEPTRRQQQRRVCVRVRVRVRARARARVSVRARVCVCARARACV